MGFSLYSTTECGVCLFIVRQCDVSYVRLQAKDIHMKLRFFLLWYSRTKNTNAHYTYTYTQLMS